MLPGPPFTLRPARVGDFAFLYDLQRAAYRDYVIQTWGAWDEAWQRARFAAHFSVEGEQILVVDGQDVGALCVEERPDALVIANIRIAPAFRNRGLGTALLQQVLAEAARRGLPVDLQVLKVNPAGRLYERLGFHVVGETSTHVLMRHP